MLNLIKNINQYPYKYFEKQNILLINADCFEIMQNMESNCCNGCITSPPYNIGNNNMTEKKYHNLKENDNLEMYDLFLIKFTELLLKVCDKYVFVNIQSLSNNKIDIIKWLYELKLFYKESLIWHKNNAQPAIEEGVLTSQFENIYCFSKESPEKRKFKYQNFTKRTLPNIFNINGNQKNDFSSIHKATFPLFLPKFFISNFFYENDIIIDPFGGLGTSAIASYDLKRKCICIEKDKIFFENSVKRCEEHFKQLSFDF